MSKSIIKAGLFAVSAAMMLLVLYLIFFWVPTERNLGISQRIFYYHVPMAWVGFLAFFFVLIGSVGYLWKRSEIWDRLAHSSAEIGVLFTTLMLATGVLWAKPVWGVWWTWDPRLTTSLILWLIYVAYLMLRAYAPAGEQRARFASVLGIVGFIDVPIVYLSIVWWRTVHPQVLVGPVAQSSDLDPAMRSLLMISTLAFTLLFGYLLWERVSVRSYEDKLDSLKGMFESPLR